MRQVIIALSLLGSFLVYAATINLLETAVMFLLFGILPGGERLTANQMLTLYAGAGLIVFMAVFRGGTITLFDTFRTSLRPKHSQVS